MSTQDITIQGTVFTIAAPYAEGYALKTHEAAALNSLLGENVRNNTAALVRNFKLGKAGIAEAQAKEMKADAIAAATAAVELSDTEKADLQAQIDKYVQEYEFGARTGGRAKDPLEREVDSIVTDMLEKALKAKNMSPSKMRKDAKDKYDALYARVLDQHREKVYAEAKKRLAAAAKIAGDTIDLGDI